MNQSVIDNYSRVKISLLYLPIVLLMLIAIFLYSQDALNIDGYRSIQAHSFFYLNQKLSQFPALIYNLTQVGDGFVLFSLISILTIYAAETIGTIINALLATALITNLFKWLFGVPRPAATFDNDKFVIIGQTLRGHNSLPSGHSLTIFAIFTVLLIGFMPKQKIYKILWCICIVVVGLLIASTRVGVGAHYPLDVLTGSILGYIAGLIGIYLNRKYRIWAWMSQIKYYPFFIVVLLVCAIVMATKIINEPLFIYFMALVSTLISLFYIIRLYAQYIKK
ncbi:MAG: phosphatase PAP2 family protein [Bacteroidetes bacterium]|nr:phosphatase PAP2 family protein [Bacteroidota bacterium]